MPPPEDAGHSESEDAAPDTLDGILGAAFGRDSTVSGTSDAPAAPQAIGPFRILKTLGRGGMGLVYLAEDTRLARRRVAIKVLTAVAAGEGPPRERLLREAAAASKLDHPGICPVYEVGEADGVPYIAMRYVPGEPLSEKVRRAREALASGEHSALLEPPDTTPSDASQASGATVAGSRAETVRVIHLVEKAARALHTAHEAHLVHRDVKPANIMVTPYGEPVLLDFGLARMADSELPSLTRTGQLVGTPAYMAPEQIDEHRGAIDRRTDVYGLGVTLHECLTLRQPFAGATREQLYRSILEDEPPPIRRTQARLPKDLEAVVATALEKSPVRRYRTALDLAEDLRRVREHQPTRARPVRPLERVVRYARRRPTRAALVLLLTLGIPLVAWMAGYIVAKRPMVAKQEAVERRDRIQAYLRAGFDALLFRADHTEAAAAFDAALALDPTDVEAVGGKALALLEHRDGADCLAFLRARKPCLAEEPALRKLEIDALKLLDRDEEAAAIEPRPPTTAFGFFLEGARLMRGFLTERDESKLRAALDFLRLAVMSSREARPLYHRHWAQVAYRLEDPEISRRAALAVTAAWRTSAAAWASACVAMTPIDPEKALVAIDRAIELDPERSEWHYKRSSVLSKLDRDRDALAASRRAVACDPEDAVAWTTLGVDLQNLDRLDESANALEEATRLAPRWYAPWRRLARTRCRQDRYEEALAAVDRALSLRDDDLDGWMLKGMILDLMQRRDEALVSLGRAAALDEQYAPAHQAIGRIHYRTNRFELAKEALKRAIACDPEYAQAYADLGIALRYGEGRDLAAALVMLRKAISLDKTNPTFRFHLARVHQQRGEPAEAIRVYGDAIGLRPDYAEAYGNRGAAHYALKQYDRAIADGREAIDLDPKHVGARGLLGTVYAIRGQHELSAKSFAEAVELEPGYPDLWYGLAQARGALGQLEAALAAQRRCLETAKPEWGKLRGARLFLWKIEQHILGPARAAAITGFGTRSDSADDDGAHALALARDEALEGFTRLIESWRWGVKRGGKCRTHVSNVMDRLLHHREFGAIPESEAFAALPERERERWLAVWHALKELE